MAQDYQGMREGEDIDNCVVFDSVNNLIKLRARDGASGTTCRTFAISGASEVVKPAAVTISVNGSSTSASREVTFSCETSGVTIRYTTDGTEPTTSSTVAQNNQVTLNASSGSETTTFYIRAVAIKNGEVGDATSEANKVEVVLSRHCATPTITIGDDLAVTITSTDGATIKYTLDGSNPASSETAETYNSSNKPSLSAPLTTIKAYATLSAYQPSEVATKTQKVARYGFGGTTLSDISTLVNAMTGGSTGKLLDSTKASDNYTAEPSATSYFWVCIPSDMSIEGAKLNGYPFALTEPVTLDGFKCYRKVSDSVTGMGAFTFVIEYVH